MTRAINILPVSPLASLVPTVESVVAQARPTMPVGGTSHAISDPNVVLKTPGSDGSIGTFVLDRGGVAWSLSEIVFSVKMEPVDPAPRRERCTVTADMHSSACSPRPSACTARTASCSSPPHGSPPPRGPLPSLSSKYPLRPLFPHGLPSPLVPSPSTTPPPSLSLLALGLVVLLAAYQKRRGLILDHGL
jgi:hypothetical protein